MSKQLSKRMIFENQHVETLCLRYKRNQDFATYFRICDHLTNLLHSIIRKSKYHRTVPFQDLMAGLYTQVGRWALKWTPGAGMFYTYAATSAKHGCISQLTKESVYRGRFCEMGDTPVDAFGSVSVNYDMIGYGRALADKIAEIESRWNEPHIREAVRVCLVSILRHRGEARERDFEGKSIDHRKNLIKTLTLGYDVSVDEAKFLIDWSLSSVRFAILDQFSSPLGSADLLRLHTKYSFVPDLVQVIGVESTRKLLHIFSGTAIRFPTMSQLRKASAAGENVNACLRGGLQARELSEEDEASLLDTAALIRTGILEDKPVFDEDGEEALLKIFNGE